MNLETWQKHLLDGLRRDDCPLSNVPESKFIVKADGNGGVLVTWTRTNDDHEYFLRFRPVTGDNTRYLVSGSYPSPRGLFIEVYDAEGNRVPSPSITVSNSRSWYDIGRDVAKRFVPAYVRRFDLVVKRIKMENDYADKQRRLVNQIGVALGAPPDYVLASQRGCSHLANSNNVSLKGAAAGKFWADFTVGSESADVKIHSLTAKQAVELAQFLKKLQG
jgi:hypothetical protein